MTANSRKEHPSLNYYLGCSIIQRDRIGIPLWLISREFSLGHFHFSTSLSLFPLTQVGNFAQSNLKTSLSFHMTPHRCHSTNTSSSNFAGNSFRFCLTVSAKLISWYMYMHPSSVRKRVSKELLGGLAPHCLHCLQDSVLVPSNHFSCFVCLFVCLFGVFCLFVLR